MIYFPSASAEVPFEVPLTKIDVPGKGCFVSWTRQSLAQLVLQRKLRLKVIVVS
jgi:hypothetical protein